MQVGTKDWYKPAISGKQHNSDGSEWLPLGSSGGSHHHHYTIPTKAEAVDNARCGGYVLHFLERWFSSFTSSHWLFLNTFSLFSILLFSPTAIPAVALGVHADVGVHSDLRSCLGGELKSPPPTLCSAFPLWVQVRWLPGRVDPCSICSLRCGWAEEPYKSTWLSLTPDLGSLYRAGRAIPVPCAGRWTEFQSSLQCFITVTSACHIRVQ